MKNSLVSHVCHFLKKYRHVVFPTAVLDFHLGLAVPI